MTYPSSPHLRPILLVRMMEPEEALRMIESDGVRQTTRQYKCMKMKKVLINMTNMDLFAMFEEL